MALDGRKTLSRKFISDSFKKRCSTIKCILYCYFLVNKPIWNETYADALKRDLLMSYDKFARPTQHYNVTNVTVDLKIKHVDFDESTSIFTVYGWFGMVSLITFNQIIFLINSKSFFFQGME